MGANALFRSVIKVSCLCQKICGDCHVFPTLTIDIGGEFLFEGNRSVELRIQRSRQLQLVISIEFRIFLYRLPICLSVPIVFIIGINELRTGYRDTIHRHHHRIRLCLCREHGEPKYWK